MSVATLDGSLPVAVGVRDEALAPAVEDPIATLEKLAGLVQKGVLTAEEFAAKKAELLARIR